MADISSVGYIHNQILSQKGLDIPIPSGVNVSYIASERYLMAQIDAANLALNGRATSDYATSARPNVVAHDKALNDIVDLIVLDVPAPQPQVFTTNTTFIVPSGYTKIDVFAVGGGGGGGGDANPQGNSGGGGFGGDVVYTTITVTPGQSIPVVIGAGGAGGGYTGSGGRGGTTTFGSVAASGGMGGPGTSAGYNGNSNGGTNGGAGRAGTDGTACPIDVPIASGKLFGARGGGGSSAYGVTHPRSPGGNTGGGAGGAGGNNTATNRGESATFYGGGGGGGAFSSSHSYGSGGAGYQGIVIVRLYN